MHHLRLALFLSVMCASGAVGQTVSDPDIFLMPLSRSGAKISVGKPVNITNRRGYDNQPSFTPDGRMILYTSTREDAQSDIYRYKIETMATERVTTSAPESEYSATIMPSHERISAIRVEKDSTQRLWSFDLKGNDARLVLTDIKPVGYHAWIDPFHLALFVLGTPNSLVLADTRTGKGRVIARDIGRALLALPTGHGFTFLSHHGQEWVLTEVRLNRTNDSVRYTRPLVTLPAGMDYVSRIGSTLIGGSGTKLYTLKSGGQWTELADVSSEGLTHISRIAVSPSGRMLAIVAEPAPGKP